MSIDYYVCHNCNNAFPDCGAYVKCESCFTHWCSEECAEQDGYISEHCKAHSDLTDRDLMEMYREKNCNYEDCCDCEHYEPDSCKYCRKEDFEDYELLEYAMELLNVTRVQLIQGYKIRKRK